MSNCDLFCENILNPFIKKIINININLNKNIININDDEVKKLEHIINLYNELTSNNTINKKSNRLDDFEIIDFTNDDDIKTNDDEKKILNEKVLNMIKKSKIIFDFYEKNTIITIKSKTLNDDTSESDDESMNDSDSIISNMNDVDDNDVILTESTTKLC
jgi:hypothetical protein